MSQMTGIGLSAGLFIEECMTENMWPCAVGRQIGERCGVLAFLMLIAVMCAGCSDRETVLVIEKPTEVHAITQVAPSQDQSTNVQPGNVIATLQSGETVRAVGVYHGQDHDGFKVKLADGTEGLIMAGETFKVVSR